MSCWSLVPLSSGHIGLLVMCRTSVAGSTVLECLKIAWYLIQKCKFREILNDFVY